MFSKEELLRYSRHLNLPDFNLPDQIKLKEAKILIVGCGGLGAPIIQYLAAAGVGLMGLVDHDNVDLSNLQRQTLFKTGDVGKNKALIAAEYVNNLNPNVHTQIISNYLDSTNAMEIISSYDMIIDGTDNLPTRYLLNDASIFAGIPLVHGSIYRYEGHVAVFNFKIENDHFSSNYRDLFPEPPPPSMVPSCAEGGVLGVLPGMVGTIMASESLKIIRGHTPALVDKLMIIDAETLNFRKIKINKRTDNPLTGDDPGIHNLIDYEKFCQGPLSAINEISPKKLEEWKCDEKEVILIDVREENEYLHSNITETNIPLSGFKQKWQEIPLDKTVIFYCQSGKRSKKAIAFLNEKGWKGRAVNLKGGLEAYLSMKKP